MSEPTPPSGSASVLDFLVMPEGANASGVPNATTPAANRPGIGRAIGALLFWSVIQTVPLISWEMIDAARGAARGAPPSAAASQFHPIIPPFAGACWAVGIALAFLWRFVWRGGAQAEYRRDTFRLRPIPRGVAARLPLVALPLLVCVVTSLVIMPRFVAVPPDTDDPLQRYLTLPFGLLAVVALAALVAPLLEEFLFRGWIQRRLEARLTPFVAILLSASLFAAVHGQLFGFPIRLVFGLAAGYAAWSTRSIWPGVLLHAIYNGTLLLGGSAGPDVSEGTLTTWAHTPSIFWPSVVAFFVAALLLVAGLRSIANAAGRPTP